MKIRNIKAREILDSRGNPTIEVDVILESGAIGRFAVPSGASTGEHEALELRDRDAARFQGRGVLKAIANIHEKIFPALKGMEVDDQDELDNALIALDGTANKASLGANALLGVSVAAAKSAAQAHSQPLYGYLNKSETFTLPVPLMNVINGGAHADNGLAIQEFMIVPVGAPTFKEAVRYGAEVFDALKSNLRGRGLSTSVGDEGGFAPLLKSTEDACETLIAAINRSGFEAGSDVVLAIDAAASEFYDRETRSYLLDSQRRYSSPKMADFWSKLCVDYPIFSIEDGLDQNDWDGWRYLTEKIGSTIQLVGDDLFVTNPQFIKRGIEERVANSVLIKLNQIGTLSETRKAIELAQGAGYRTIMSHRSGETEDTTIADLAVAFETGQIKTGSLSRSDRVSKYNQLLRIEEELGSAAHFAGKSVLAKN